MTDSDAREYRMSIDIDAPIQKVWDEITRTGRIQRPLYNTVLETTFEVGSKLRYYSPDKKRVFVVGEVLAVEPPFRFKHTYVFTTTMEPPTEVTWELTERPGGCTVTLTHGGWTDRHSNPEKSAAGWREILALLKAEVETGQIPVKTRILYAIMGKAMFMLPKSTTVAEVARAGY